MSSHSSNQRLFSFKTPTKNPDYLSLYTWVPYTNHTDDHEPINIQLSTSDILSKIARHPAVMMDKDKNQLSIRESRECSNLYIELLEKISDLFTKMPNHLLEQLPGYTGTLLGEIKRAKLKLKLLQTTNDTDLVIEKDDMTSNHISYNNGDVNKSTASVENITPMDIDGGVTINDNESPSTSGSQIVEDESIDYDLIDIDDTQFEPPTWISATTTNTNTSPVPAPVDTSSDNESASVYSDDRIYLELTLKHNFRLQNFREKQMEAINAARFGYHCIITMPPGSGKSLCYQMAALLSPGVTIVISPFLSLINKQIERLNLLQIKAVNLGEKLGKKTMNVIKKKLSMKEPDIKILYVTPKKLLENSELLDLLVSPSRDGLISRFVIEEAQCVLPWDVGYLNAYSKLKELRKKFSVVPVTALSSCATNRTVTDIRQHLDMRHCKVFRTSLNRPNISYNVVSKRSVKVNDLEHYMCEIVRRKYARECGIIYCLTSIMCEKMAAILTAKGVSAVAYYSARTEKAADESMSRDESFVICTTEAYAARIANPAVRFVLHHGLPRSVQSYYHASARAGRDGRPAGSYLFFCEAELACGGRAGGSDPGVRLAREIRQSELSEMYLFCITRNKCRRLALLQCLNDEYNKDTCEGQHACDHCSGEAEAMLL